MKKHTAPTNVPRLDSSAFRSYLCPRRASRALTITLARSATCTGRRHDIGRNGRDATASRTTSPRVTSAISQKRYGIPRERVIGRSSTFASPATSTVAPSPTSPRPTTLTTDRRAGPDMEPDRSASAPWPGTPARSGRANELSSSCPWLSGNGGQTSQPCRDGDHFGGRGIVHDRRRGCAGL
jgi:hypothetical protein